MTLHVAVCGAGVIGAATAFFLAERGAEVTLVERGHVACAASGKSGGFLALDWCDGSALGPLARVSFALHERLATQLSRQFGDVGYRRVDTLLVQEEPERNTPDGFWLDRSAHLRGQLGNRESTAQVQPRLLTEALVDAAVSRGARLVTATADRLATRVTESGERVVGVHLGGAVLDADAVVLAMGPWTAGFAQALGLPPVAGLRGNSIHLRPTQEIPAHCLFVETDDPAAGNISPEIYPRPDGEVYVCGMADDIPVPEDPLSIQPNEQACGILAGVAARLSSHLATAEIVRQQACYRPIVADGLPLLGAIEGYAGAYVATAHNCWGILNAPGSGLAMAELIVEGEASTVDLRPFTPSRASLRQRAVF
ncbi:MAG: FAD-dependent oxidoreductase [Pseudomonadota bacterium]